MLNVIAFYCFIHYDTADNYYRHVTTTSWLMVKCYSSSEKTSPLRAMERHLPYEITQCYLSPDTGERALP